MISFSSLENKISNADNNHLPNYLVLLAKNVTSSTNIINGYKSILKFPEINCIELDGENVDFNTILNAVEKLPLMDKFSMVVVTKASFITTKGKDKQKILKSLNKFSVPSHCILILQEYVDETENLKKNTKLPKLEKQGAVIVYSPKFSLLEGTEELKKRNIELELNNDTIFYIYKKVGDNLDVFINECRKVSMLPQKYLTEEILDKVITKNVTNSVFDIVNALIQKKLSEGLYILDNLLASGTQPLEIFGALHSQIKLLYYAKQFSQNGKKDADFAEKFKLHPYRAKIGFQQSQSFTNEKLSQLFILCNDMEQSIKFSSFPKIELEKVIIQLCN